MLPVSGETNTESLITEPINFILSNKVKDGTDDTLPDIRYKDAIDAIQHSNEIIDNNIFIVKNSYFLEVRMVSLSELSQGPCFPVRPRVGYFTSQYRRGSSY